MESWLYMADIVNRVKELRLGRGWTQEQLAEAAGITTTYTSDLKIRWPDGIAPHARKAT